jgi:activating signal cointegrator complex subunit 3
MVHDIKKEYYKKFLYEPFPVESSLCGVFACHLNAEVCAGTIKSKNDCILYLSWTFLYRRLLKNPSYYGLPDAELNTVSNYLTNLVDDSVEELIDCYCISLEDDNRTLVSLPLGRITSFYYLHHKTVKMFAEKLTSNNQDFENLLWILSRSLEFSELPVRHNEDILNKELNELLRYKVKDESFDSSHTKTYILLQAHFSRIEMPCSDYLTDLKSVMDQCIRVLQAMIDIVSMKGLSFICLRLITIMQMIMQGRWYDGRFFFDIRTINFFLICLKFYL